MEKRTAYIPAEFTAREENGEKIIEGKFIVFNERMELYPGTYEAIAPEAINDISNVRALYNHNRDLVLGSTTSNTLILSKKDDGLYGLIKVNSNDTDALNAHARISRGDITGCSFGFIPINEEYDEKERLITIRELALYEVSPCVFPAYQQTAVSARSKELIEKKFEEKSSRHRAKKILERIRGNKNGSKTTDK